MAKVKVQSPSRAELGDLARRVGGVLYQFDQITARPLTEEEREEVRGLLFTAIPRLYASALRLGVDALELDAKLAQPLLSPINR